jgi:hypothetical protein
MMNTLKSNPALLVGALYTIGIFITALHLSRFGISDLDLTRIRYVFAGVVFCYFLVLRLAAAALILDYRLIRKTYLEATELTVRELRRSLIFKVIDEISKVPWIGGILFSGYTSEEVAAKLIKFVTLGSVFVLVAGFGLIIQMPEPPGVWNLYPPPFLVVGLVGIELAYLIYLIFNRPMNSIPRLAGLWNCVLVLLLLVDIWFYALSIHPLVKPIFGGGVVTTSQVIPKDDDSRKILEGSGVIRVSNGIGSPLYILHSTDKSLYVTKQFRLNVFARSPKSFISHSRIIQISRDLLAGQFL